MWLPLREILGTKFDLLLFFEIPMHVVYMNSKEGCIVEGKGRRLSFAGGSGNADTTWHNKVGLLTLLCGGFD